MRLLTTEEMKTVENFAMTDRGVPSLLLMENAAIGATQEILKLSPKRVVIFCGKGNNGGDGLAVARKLVTYNVYVKVYFVGETEKATLDCNTNYGILKSYEKIVQNLDIEKYEDISKLDISGFDLLVDALIGTGLKKELTGKYKDIVEYINSSNIKVLAIDCPTGINADNGHDKGLAVNADITVTFHLPKIGLYLYPAYERCGKIVVKDIGVPYLDEGKNSFLPDKNWARDVLPKRSRNTHKGTYGKSVFISGCDTMAGAAVFNCISAYNVGSGLVNACTTEKAIDIIHTLVPEAITTRREELEKLLKDSSSAFAIGSGLGRQTDDIVYQTVKKCTGSLVIDADGINALAERPEILKEHISPCIITPHIKEMARLVNSDTRSVAANMVKVAKEVSLKYNVVTVLKSANTVITSPDGRLCINTTGNSALSKGGSGDCLTGIITGLLAQKVPPFEAAVLGAYIFGLCGEWVAKEKTEYSVMAQDSARAIPYVIKDILG